jgi:Protein of unknown function (DUF3606)
VPNNARKSLGDRARIDVRDDQEIRYWCRYFACTAEQLFDCMNIVGFDVAKVARYLNQGLRLVAGTGRFR